MDQSIEKRLGQIEKRLQQIKARLDLQPLAEEVVAPELEEVMARERVSYGHTPRP